MGESWMSMVWSQMTDKIAWGLLWLEKKKEEAEMNKGGKCFVSFFLVKTKPVTVAGNTKKVG